MLSVKKQNELTSWRLWFPSQLFGLQPTSVVKAAWGSLHDNNYNTTLIKCLLTISTVLAAISAQQGFRFPTLLLILSLFLCSFFTNSFSSFIFIFLFFNCDPNNKI